MTVERADAVIVGSGASGSVLATELSRAGLQVVLLERGPELDPDKFNLHDEKTALGGMTRYPPWREDERHPREFRYRGDDHFSLLYSHQWGYSSSAAVVGGGMLVFGGLMWRRPPAEFRMKTEYGHVEGTTLEDWPFSYDVLEPSFTKAEYEMGVSGKGGENP